MTGNEHVIVLGGGISGLGLAWRMASAGVPVDVLEAETTVGGLARTDRVNGYGLDVGPHSFFSEDAALVGRILALFETPLSPRPRRVKFLYEGQYLEYPLTVQGVLFHTGLRSGLRTALSYLKQKAFPLRIETLGTEQETVRDWAIASFGEHLYRSFFKPYTEQFWKVPCMELSSRSIPSHTRMSFTETLRVLFGRTRDSDGASLIEREALPTYYPPTGFGEIAERIAAAVRGAGGRVHLGCRVCGVSAISGGWRVTAEGAGRGPFEATHVVSTVPLPVLCRMLDPVPPPEVLASVDRLDYRALTVLGLVTEKQDILGCGYIYVLNRPYNRISEMNEFSPAASPAGENIVAVELPCLAGSTVWKASPEELFEMCIGALAEDGFLQPGDVKRLLVLRAAHAYPVYRKDYAQHLSRVMQFIRRTPNLSTLGRCGEFMYMDIDRCLKRALGAADELLQAIGAERNE